jgi:hypothetical protein
MSAMDGVWTLQVDLHCKSRGVLDAFSNINVDFTHVSNGPRQQVESSLLLDETWPP